MDASLAGGDMTLVVGVLKIWDPLLGSHFFYLPRLNQWEWTPHSRCGGAQLFDE